METWSLYIGIRTCGFCNKEIKKDDICVQVPTDNNFRGFEYPHKACIEKALVKNLIKAK
jgi:hypothetical protein